MSRRLLTTSAALALAALLALALAPGAGADPDDAGDGTATPTAPPSGAGGTTVESVATEAEYRQAIIDLSADGAGPHTIEITADFVIGTVGDPEYTGTQALTINGNGNTVDSTIDDTRFLDHDSDANLTINDLTVSDFQRDGAGAAIRSDADQMFVNDSTFVGNSTVDSDGGAIDTQDDIFVERSTFDGNSAPDSEGTAIDTSEEGAAVISQSTFVGNTGADADAAVSAQSDITIVNSTFTANESDGVVEADNDLTVTYVTVADNDASAAALSTENDEEGELSSFGTVVTDNGGDSCSAFGSVSSSYSYSSDATCGFTGTGDVENGTNAGLEPLASNGGPTQTMAIGEDGDLFDAIANADCDPGLITVDQRNEPRPGAFTEQCDIGAFELQFDPPVDPVDPVGPDPDAGAGGAGPISAAPGFAG